jgi:V8-like Glu-specific endopeptidase
MACQRESAVEFTVQELDRELIARGARVTEEERFEFNDREGTPERHDIMARIKGLYYTAPAPNQALSYISTEELVKILVLKTRELNATRAIYDEDDRLDFYEIPSEQIRQNAGCVAAICRRDYLIPEKSGFAALKVKNYGKTFNLSDYEPFHQQPIAAGRLCSGFLVKEDVIATAGHCANDNNVTDLRFIFGYRMADAFTPVIRVPSENIYRGVDMIRQVYRCRGDQSDWALLRLDRKVAGQGVARLSERKVCCDQPVYVIGHPAGLPLKFAAGARVLESSQEAYFAAGLDIYMGNSGSPVFDGDTHEVVGMVVRGFNRDFRWTDKGWLSVVYPDFDGNGKGAQCTRVSEFIHIVNEI